MSDDTKTNVVKFPMTGATGVRWLPEDSEIDHHSAYHAMVAARRVYHTQVLRAWRADGVKPCPSTDKIMRQGAAPDDRDELLKLYKAVPPAKRHDFVETVRLFAGLVAGFPAEGGAA
jgi:hypothetical protein